MQRAWNKEEKITLTTRRQCGKANHDQLHSCLIIKNFVNDLIVGAVDELGDMPYYAEHCAAMLAVTYSSGQGMQRNIVSVLIRMQTLSTTKWCHYAVVLGQRDKDTFRKIPE